MSITPTRKSLILHQQKSGKRKNFTRKSCQFVNNWDVFLCAKKSDIAESYDNEIIVGFELIKKVEMALKIGLRTKK